MAAGRVSGETVAEVRDGLLEQPLSEWSTHGDVLMRRHRLDVWDAVAVLARLEVEGVVSPQAEDGTRMVFRCQPDGHPWPVSV